MVEARNKGFPTKGVLNRSTATFLSRFDDRAGQFDDRAGLMETRTIMPTFDRAGATIHYEEAGDPSAFPILLFAPGGMLSAASFWERSPWNPVVELASDFRVIAMDQRNAGRSTAPVTADDGWHTYTADHLALLDHLDLERCHVLGGCIGGPYCLGVMEAAPARVAAAVLQQPIGLSSENRDAFYAMFDSWANELRKRRSDVSEPALACFRERMYGGDFVFNVSRDFVRGCDTPILVLMGADLYHPTETSREIVALAPRAKLIEHWKGAGEVEVAVTQVREFLRENTPGS
jgi:pimeloyl-ACP methyl ester carboxylesterase